MRHILEYDGVSSLDFGLWIGFAETDNAPQRSIESIEIPGRNGALTIDNGRFENITVSYKCVIPWDYERNVAAARAVYLSRVGYHRLEDSAHPDEFRMARYHSGLESVPSQMRQQGYFTLEFDCMPQRFLRSGENKTIATSENPNITIFNATMFNALPLLRVYGNGEIHINDSTITISTESPYVDIDCETLDCYYEGTSENHNVQFSEYKFPELVPGDNSIAFDGEITSIEVTPRWWTI